MDSFDTLMEKKQYNLIIKATETSKDSSSLIYRIMAFASMEKFDDALNVITTNKEELETNALPILIMIHVDLLCMRGDIFGAFELAKYYGELPYHSQEVEEIIANIPNQIKEYNSLLKQSVAKNVSDDEIIETLKSDNYDDVILGIDYLKERKIDKFLPYLLDIMVDFPKQSIRSLALLTLVEKEYDVEVNFLSTKGLIKINPSKCNPPFKKENFKDICSELEKEKDVTLSNIMVNNFSALVINNYPQEYSVNDSIILAAIKVVSYKSLRKRVNYSSISAEFHVDVDDLKIKVNEIEEALDEF